MLRASEIPLWFIPSFHGDIRLETVKENKTLVVVNKLTATEVNAMSPTMMPCRMVRPAAAMKASRVLEDDRLGQKVTWSPAWPVDSCSGAQASCPYHLRSPPECLFR